MFYGKELSEIIDARKNLCCIEYLSCCGDIVLREHGYTYLTVKERVEEVAFRFLRLYDRTYSSSKLIL
jgi:hypothetical protein